MKPSPENQAGFRLKINLTPIPQMGCSLRPGNVHSADNWKAVLDPVVQRYRWAGLWRRYLRGDAAFAIPELLDYLEANNFGYAIRLKANKVLERRIGHLERFTM